MTTEAEIRAIHTLDLYRDGSGYGECAPFPLDNPVCGWTGHHRDHEAHIAEMITQRSQCEHD